MTHNVAMAKNKVAEYAREAEKDLPAEVKAAYETLRVYHQGLLEALLAKVKADLVASL